MLWRILCLRETFEAFFRCGNGSQGAFVTSQLFGGREGTDLQPQTLFSRLTSKFKCYLPCELDECQL